MKRTMLWGIALVASLALGAACGKKGDDKKSSPKTTDNKKDDGKKNDGTKPDPKANDGKQAAAGGEALVKAVEQCWGYLDAKDKDKFKSCYAADAMFAIVDGPMPPAKGPDAILQQVEPLWAAFGPLKHDLNLVLVNGKKAAVIALATGKNSGDMMGNKATNKDFGVWAAQHLTVNDAGKGVDDKHYVDMGSINTQLGLPGGNPEAPAVQTKAWDQKPRIVAKNDETEKANIAFLHSLDEAIKKKDVAALTAGYADDAEFNYVAGKDVAAGMDAIKKGTKEWFDMHSEMTVTTDDVWAAGDWVVAQTTVKGTMAKDMGPMKVKGNSYEAHYLEFFQIADKKIKRHWIFSNGFKMMADLGVIKMPPAGDKK